ncbi:MAG: hypothetical protein WC314_18535 [Vulcanimicrobiota bacterium]
MSHPETAKLIEHDMHETRARIDQTVDEIGQRLSPDTLKVVARQGLVETRRYVEREAGEKLRSTTEGVTRVGRSGRNFMRSYPLTVALIGLGLGLMLSRQNSIHPTPIKGDLQ